jgi:hypothetical protein
MEGYGIDSYHQLTSPANASLKIFTFSNTKQNRMLPNFTTSQILTLQIKYGLITAPAQKNTKLRLQ